MHVYIKKSMHRVVVLFPTTRWSLINTKPRGFLGLDFAGGSPMSEGEEEGRQVQEVVAHVYDVASSGSSEGGGGSTAILHVNRFFKDAIGLGGIFHTAIQVSPQ